MHERIVGLYEEHAAAWDRQRGRELIERRLRDSECGEATVWLTRKSA